MDNYEPGILCEVFQFTIWWYTRWILTYYQSSLMSTHCLKHLFVLYCSHLWCMPCPFGILDRFLWFTLLLSSTWMVRSLYDHHKSPKCPRDDSISDSLSTQVIRDNIMSTYHSNLTTAGYISFFLGSYSQPVLRNGLRLLSFFPTRNSKVNWCYTVIHHNMCYALSSIALDNILGEIDKNVAWYFLLNWFCETVYRHLTYRSSQL